MSVNSTENGDTTQGDPVTDTGVADSTSSGDDQQTGGHPAWKEILDVLPESLYPLVTPKLEAWDAGVQTRFQNLQSQYEPYKPFIEQEVDPEYLSQAVGLAAAIEQDPERVYKALAEAYGYDQGVTTSTSDQTQVDDDDYDDDPTAARLAEHERMMEQMAGAFLADQESRENAEQSAALDSYMAALHNAYDNAGGFDENFVLNQIANGVDGETAVKGFQAMIQQYGGTVGAATGVAAAPQVMGGSGGLPTTRVDPRTLSDADTTSLVAQMLKQAQEE